MEFPTAPGFKEAYYSPDGKQIFGPTTIDEIVRCVIGGVIPVTISVFVSETKQWIHFSQLPDTWMSPPVLEQLRLFNKRTITKSTQQSCLGLIFAFLIVGGIVYWLFFWLTLN